MHASDGFDRLYRATTESRAYREAVYASASGLPNWLVPFSIVDRTLLERIASELRVGIGDTFLDLGCGAGGPGLWIADRTGASIIGVDFAPAAIAAATSLAKRLNMSGRAQFVVADVAATEIPSGGVSGVVSIDALMFVDAEDVANEIARVLSPGGIFVMTAAESLVEPFRSTLVRDYRPFFEKVGFRTISHEEPPGHVDRQLALYRALNERAERLRAEMGETAEVLLEEARNGLSRAAQRTTRVRQVLLVAERLPGNK